MGVRNYKDLDVWKKAMDLAVDVYALTENFPSSETYGLTMQMRRAAVSVPSNIAEGQARVSTKDFKRFLSISLGSLFELETQLILANRLGYIEKARFGIVLEKLQEIARMLRGLNSKLPTTH